jgi:uncharacterized protein YbjT (DUF2867 family)
MSKTILITGATGNIGSQVIPALLENGVNVRAYVRNPEKAKQLEAAGVQVFMGDFLDQDALNKAAENVDAILAITPPNPDAVAQGDTILKAALNSGSPYYLRLSAIGAAADAPTENGKLHYESDKALMESGLTYTILRPHYFMQNMFGSVEAIKSQGNFYLGMGEGRLGMIDVRDIADCFVSLLLNNGEGHKNKIYTPTGSDSINFSQAAESISSHLGKQVNYVPVPPEAVREAILELGWGEWGAQIMVDYSKAYANNWGDFTTTDVKIITGHEARSFDQFTKEVFLHAIQ